jgi:DNA polymerase-3 subunit beta
MKIQISASDLHEELYKLQGVVSKKSTLAILSNALLEAEDGRLKLHATDLDTSVSTSCECEVREPGRVTLEAKSLFNIVKNLDEEVLELETEENHWASVDSGSVSCRIVGTHPEDFPEILDTSDVEMFPIDPEVLLDMIEKTHFSISTDDARANLTGAFFRVTEDDTLLMVSTDGHRLSKIETTPEEFSPGEHTPEPLREGIIIPKKGLSQLKRTVDSDSGELSFGLVDNSVVFKHGPMTMSVRLIEGTFPDFTQVLPDETDEKAYVDKGFFEDAIKFVSLFANSKTNNLRLTLQEDGLELYASDPDSGEGKKLIPADYGGDSVKAGYNYRYLQDAIGAIDGEEISIEIIDTLSPTIIRDPDREEMLFVVMPMRL